MEPQTFIKYVFRDFEFFHPNMTSTLAKSAERTPKFVFIKFIMGIIKRKFVIIR